jgi:hypothetical protein
MQTIRRTFLIAVVIATVIAPLSRHANATTAAETSPPQSAGWMPDVAERVASLRERTERAAAEARIRRVGDAQNGQWWRAVASRPPRDRAK